MRIAINGFGRIGRNFLRELHRRNLLNTSVEVIAINDLADAPTLAHLLKYDSIHGRFHGQISTLSDSILIDGHAIQICNERNPENLPWGKLKVDLVLESTGLFRSAEKAGMHIIAGAKKVVLSAPPNDNNIPTVVVGINDHIITGKEPIISNASCTTNNVAPIFKILHENWGIESGYVSTVHSYTSDQSLHDAPHKDLRRARAGAQSIIPTTTGAAKAITRIFPELDGRIGGCGIRVPVPNGSLSDISCVVSKACTAEEVNAAFKKASSEMPSILKYETDPIVSVDILGSPYSCTFDSLLTSVIGKMVKVVGWYDNEIGYSNRLIDLILLAK
ncbi:MAG: type I glyceraldehyde-3-phosphate dehydrogenase [Flavobacteriales bacterium]|nr:type I glyceraldehyde-3-phosphate dehydrogenase [Flavobacteriales bacterium]